MREVASRITFGQKTVKAEPAGIETVTVPPTRRGAALLTAKRSPLAIRLQVTFTPKGGVARTLSVGGVHAG